MDTTNLPVAQRAALALGTAEHEKKLQALSSKFVHTVSITSQVGRDDVHSARMELVRARVAIEKAGKAAREDAQAYSKAVIAEEKRLVAIILPEEQRLEKLQDDWEAAREAERQAKIRAEQERVGAIQRRISELTVLPVILVGTGVGALAEAIDSLRMERPEVWAQEFASEAVKARDTALQKITQMHETALAAAVEAQRQAEERARIDAENKRLAEQRAAFEAEQKAAREKAEAEDRERRAKLQAEEDARRKAMQEEEDRRRAATREEEQRLAAERRELEARQRAQREEDEARQREARRAQEEQEAAQRREEQARQEAAAARRRAEEEEKAAADRERLRAETEQADARRAINLFIERFRHLPQFEPVVKVMFTWLQKNPERRAA